MHYEKHPDGRYRIRSESIPGFRLEGPDIDVLQRDLNPLVRDLLLHNMGFEVESVRWVPSPEEVKQHLQAPGKAGIVTYVVEYRAAA
jgi:hypothetical protein